LLLQICAVVRNLQKSRGLVHELAAALEAFQSAESSAELLDDGPVKNDHLARAWRGEGFVLTEQGKLDESEALYKKCLELNPDDYRARNELQYIKSLRVHPPAAPSP
jgi:tetratricopeptide (TPR) repeat protein